MNAPIRGYIPALSARQIAIVHYIRAAHVGMAEGRPDSHRVTTHELKDYFGCSMAQLRNDLVWLKAAGYLAWDSRGFNASYSLQIVRGGI